MVGKNQTYFDALDKTVSNTFHTESGWWVLDSYAANLLYIAFMWLAIIGLLLVIYAGFLWMTAQQDPKKVLKAKALLKNGVIGLVIMSGAYALVVWAFN